MAKGNQFIGINAAMNTSRSNTIQTDAYGSSRALGSSDGSSKLRNSRISFLPSVDPNMTPVQMNSSYGNRGFNHYQDSKIVFNQSGIRRQSGPAFPDSQAMNSMQRGFDGPFRRPFLPDRFNSSQSTVAGPKAFLRNGQQDGLFNVSSSRMSIGSMQQSVHSAASRISFPKFTSMSSVNRFNDSNSSDVYRSARSSDFESKSSAEQPPTPAALLSVFGQKQPDWLKFESAKMECQEYLRKR